MDALARMLVVAGLMLAGAGALIWIMGRVPGIGHLPGDILIKRGNFTFYAPLATSLLLSLLLTVLLNLWFRR